ncbi:MAG: hypothetical protein II085_03035 [Alphaproteobacteria bacterium]|nr:hypothetical protein [Alphaproteobacteria bacterium]
MKLRMKLTFLIDFILISIFLFSYYLEKQVGLLLYILISIVFMIAFILFSVGVIVASFIYRDKKNNLIPLVCVQIILCVFFPLAVFKLKIPDRIALKIEIPKLERRISSMSKEELENAGILIFEPYIISAWEPGFLDDQLVLVYDSTDELGKAITEKHLIPIGKLYPTIRASACFYLCDLER